MIAGTPTVDEYFDCPEPRGRARIRFRHCLARQAQLDTRRCVGPRNRKPLNPFCALECEVGRRVRERFT